MKYRHNLSWPICTVKKQIWHNKSDGTSVCVLAKSWNTLTWMSLNCYYIFNLELEPWTSPINTHTVNPFHQIVNIIIVELSKCGPIIVASAVIDAASFIHYLFVFHLNGSIELAHCICLHIKWCGDLVFNDRFYVTDLSTYQSRLKGQANEWVRVIWTMA